MLLYIVYGILFVNTKIKACNALNAMFVETVNTLVFVALTQHLIQSTMRCGNYSTLYKVASYPCQEGRLFVETVDMRFIQYSKCCTQNRENSCIRNTASIPDEPFSYKSGIWIQTKIRGSSGIRNVVLKTETVSTCVLLIVQHQYHIKRMNPLHVNTVDTNPDSKPQTYKAKIRGSSGIRNVLLKTERIHVENS